MNRTIVCSECDNNEIIFEKVGQQLYIKCSKCNNTILKTVHLESWNINAANTYKLRINMGDNRLFEADMIEKVENKIENKEDLKIRLMYVKEYEYIRQLEKDEYMDIKRGGEKNEV